jgi:hypothetical protein
MQRRATRASSDSAGWQHVKIRHSWSSPNAAVSASPFSAKASSTGVIV